MVGKKPHSRVLKFLLIVGCILLNDITVSAQQQNTTTPTQQQSTPQKSIASDTTAIRKQKQHFFGFFTHLFQKKKTPDDYVRKKKKSDTTVAKKPHTTPPFDLTKGSVTWTSLYTQGINLNTGVNGLYTLGHLSQGFDVEGIPLSGQATGVFDNGQFEKSYSSYSINFNPEAFMGALKKRAEDIAMNKRMGDKTPNLSDSLNAYESVRQKINSPSYQTQENVDKAQFKKDQDSAQKHPGGDTTELHSLRQKMTSYEKMEQRYNALFAIKKNYSNLEKADTSGKKYEKEEKSLDNPTNVEKSLEQNKQLSGEEKFLMGVKKFSIGQSGDEISEFTLHSFMMNGLNMAYKSGDYITDIGYGKEVAVVNPLLMTNIAIPTYHRTVDFVREGEGPENGSNFYATVIKISDPGNISSPNETNWIFDLTKKLVVGKYLSFEGELAKSTFSCAPGKADTAPLPYISQNSNTLAYALRGKGIIPKLNTIIKTEFSQTGGGYITLGNPYLISGATKYEADIDQPVGKKLDVDIGGTHIVENETSDGLKQTDNWIDCSVLYKPISSIEMEFKYAPRQFQQESGIVYANSLTSTINQISFTSIISCRVFHENTTTTIFAGNFQYNMSMTSEVLTQNLNLSYYMVNELFAISSSQAINFSVDESRSDWTGNISQFIAQSTYNWNLKKVLMVCMGPQWVEQPGVMPNEAGLTSSISSAIKKWSRIGIQLTYRNSIEKPLSSSAQYLVSGNVSILW